MAAAVAYMTENELPLVAKEGWIIERAFHIGETWWVDVFYNPSWSKELQEKKLNHLHDIVFRVDL